MNEPRYKIAVLPRFAGGWQMGSETYSWAEVLNATRWYLAHEERGTMRVMLETNPPDMVHIVPGTAY